MCVFLQCEYIRVCVCMTANIQYRDINYFSWCLSSVCLLIHLSLTSSVSLMSFKFSTSSAWLFIPHLRECVSIGQIMGQHLTSSAHIITLIIGSSLETNHEALCYKLINMIIICSVFFLFFFLPLLKYALRSWTANNLKCHRVMDYSGFSLVQDSPQGLYKAPDSWPDSH